MNLSFPPAGVAFIQNGYPIPSLEAKLVVILGSECVHCLNHLTLNCAQRKFENIGIFPTYKVLLSIEVPLTRTGSDCYTFFMIDTEGK